MSVSVPFTYSGGNLVFVAKGKPYKVSTADRNFTAVANALKDGKNEQDILEIFKVGTNLSDYLKNNERVQFDGTNVLVNGQVLHDSIVQKVRDIASYGLPVEPILHFIENIELNPSFNSKTQSYEFLEHSDIALTEDGCFVAYRAVNNDYSSKRRNKDGTVNMNRVGDRVVMDRSEVDDNPKNHCSQGLHVGSIKYAGKGGFYHNGGDRTMLVKVNPKDVVSVPDDHDCQKCRVCEYLVVGEVDEPLMTPLFTADGNPYPVEFTQEDFGGFEYDEDDDYEEDSWTYDEEDEYDSEIDFDDDDDYQSPPEIRLS